MELKTWDLYDCQMIYSFQVIFKLMNGIDFITSVISKREITAVDQ